jgi:hypothetical protein
MPSNAKLSLGKGQVAALQKPQAYYVSINLFSVLLDLLALF